MKAAPYPANETSRLAALRRYRILDTDPEKSFDDLTYVASFICQTPIALVSFVDKDRQWFKSRIGLEPQETSREVSFCAHAILKPETLIVPDTFEDSRFADNPLVREDPNIRFYAGAPLFTADSLPLGTLCVIDRIPRTLSEEQQRALEALSRQASALIEMRRTLMELNEALGTLKMLGGILPICASCKKIRDEQGKWHILEAYIQNHSEAQFSHGVCPECAQRLYPDHYKRR
jgi:GAF domain-containing protein